MQMSTTIRMPKKPQQEEGEEEIVVSQVRPAQKRFRVSVDRQVKSSFDKAEDAEKAARKIKTAFPIVSVAVYDAEESSSTDIE
jgi:hypothetical protein